ncbi:hypothetical protein EXM22_01015 [Oceanispirochaeta crateris]|uniref:Outer membrane protein beta-barrel domain-containing protein n=1 Tax=Oceanispirochaeta crateris TaxID=2518645 RepID=A0A5C1QGQ3_9SPIO|nr:hypothetical protein [Oceanispirochaeta crateris]QEN06637.1 hypothetical protein EXM22_01015 [Oceanispirochaeta crateris]
MKNQNLFKYTLKLFVLLTAIIPVNTINAEEVEREPNILVFTKSDSKDFLKLINDTTTNKLKEYNLNTIQVEDVITIEELLDKAGWLGAFFIIETHYTQTDHNLSLIMNCYSTWDKQLLISIQRDSYLEGFSNAYINSSVDRIIPVIREHLEIVKAEPPPGWDWWSNNKVDSEEGFTEVEKVPTESIEEAPLEIEAEVKEVKIEESLITVSLSGSPLISTGKAAEYFSYGSHFSLYGAYQLKKWKMDLDLGGRISWDHFESDGLLTSSTNNFYSLGPEIQMSLGIASGSRLLARLSSGLSYFTVNSSNKDLTYSTLPYLSLGLGAEIPLYDSFSFYYSGDYTFYFEQSTIFSGFYPTLGVNLSL